MQFDAARSFVQAAARGPNSADALRAAHHGLVVAPLDILRLTTSLDLTGLDRASQDLEGGVGGQGGAILQTTILSRRQFGPSLTRADSRQVPGVTPNETRDPDGTGRIVKFGPDRVEVRR